MGQTLQTRPTKQLKQSTSSKSFALTNSIRNKGKYSICHIWKTLFRREFWTFLQNTILFIRSFFLQSNYICFPLWESYALIPQSFLWIHTWYTVAAHASLFQNLSLSACECLKELRLTHHAYFWCNTCCNILPFNDLYRSTNIHITRKIWSIWTLDCYLIGLLTCNAAPLRIFPWLGFASNLAPGSHCPLYYSSMECKNL